MNLSFEQYTDGVSNWREGGTTYLDGYPYPAAIRLGFDFGFYIRTCKLFLVSHALVPPKKYEGPLQFLLPLR